MQVFFGGRQYRMYLRLLAERCAAHELRVWTYCLMPNHVQLIVVPTTDDGLWRPLASAHRGYAWTINRKKEWVGHLWQERFSSFPMDETHLFFAARYVLLNPVRAGLVRRPEDWPYSSVRAHLYGDRDPLIDPSPMADRIEDWNGYLVPRESEARLELLRRHVRSGKPLGCPAWLREVASTS